MSNTRRPERMKLHATMPGSTALRHRAVVAGVALRAARGARVVRLIAGPARGMLHLEADVRDDLGLGVVGDVDDAGRARPLPSGRSTTPVANSSTSTRYGWPPMVTGIAICGMLSSAHVMWLTLVDLRVRTAGLDLADVEDRSRAPSQPMSAT